MTNPPAASPASSQPSPPVRRFGLSGPTVSLNPAVNAFRADIADIALAGQVIASHYAQPAVRRCIVATEMRAAQADTKVVATLNVGDAFAVLDCGRGLAWGYTMTDHRVGYVDENSLA